MYIKILLRRNVYIFFTDITYDGVNGINNSHENADLQETRTLRSS